eukprot:11186619-Ditylum_brightwellii.AAC.1
MAMTKPYNALVHCIMTSFDMYNIELQPSQLENIADPHALGTEVVMMGYYAMYVTAIIKTLMLH